MKRGIFQVRSKIWVEISGRPALGPGRRKLLRAVDEQGSISGAARFIGMTYRKAWGQIQAMEEEFGAPLVTKQTGGKDGGGARLTPEARDLIARYDQLIEGVEDQVNAKFKDFFYGDR